MQCIGILSKGMGYILYLLLMLMFYNKGSQDDLVLLASDDTAVTIPSYLTKCSSVLQATQRYRQTNKKVGSFGFTSEQLQLLITLLDVEHNSCLPQRGDTWPDHYGYEMYLLCVVAKFKQLCKAETYALSFEMADFFDMPHVMSILIDAQVKPEHTHMALQTKCAQSLDYPYERLLYQALAQRLLEKEEYAKQLYYACQTLTPFFKGLSIKELLAKGLLHLPSIIVYDPSCHALNLAQKQLASLDGLEDLPYVPIYSQLFLNFNRLCDLPPSVALFKSLTLLWLDNNNLELFPQALATLPHLRELYLDENRINRFPYISGGASCERLAVLSLNGNSIEKIPAIITGFPSLRWLSINNNRVKSFPAHTKGLEQLLELSLQRNLIHELPSLITGLYSLTTLHVDNNEISALPPLVEGLDQLVNLSLSYNKIQEIPKTIVGLETLKTLNMMANQCIEIPKSITGLGLLEELNISFNAIANNNVKKNGFIMKSYEPPLVGLNNLQKLMMSGNPLSSKKVAQLVRALNSVRSEEKSVRVINLNIRGPFIVPYG